MPWSDKSNNCIENISISPAIEHFRRLRDNILLSWTEGSARMASKNPDTLAAYEQPLNERVRTLLRLEHLFQQAEFGMSGDSEWHSRQTITTLLDILSVLSARGDVRAELIKELQRITTTLARLENSPGVDPVRLQPALEECRRLAESMKSVRGLPGGEMKNDELLNSVMQRAGIPGGACGFDLPAYQYWLLQPAPERQAQLGAWMATLDNLRQSTALVLRMLRESATPIALTAPAGIYQQTPDKDTQAQLIRVLLPADSPCFAEISGSRYFFTIRFMQQTSTHERPVQSSDDIEFQLCNCGL
jgi:cell division protein ZapD